MRLDACIHDLMDHVPVSGRSRADLLRRMRAPGRDYHSDAHAALLWQRHLVFGRGGPFRQPAVERLIAAAIAYHDAVLDTRRTDNEAEAAALWRSAARRDGLLPHTEIAWVAATIEATGRHLAPLPAATLLDRARIWMLDLDLTPLGERPDAFARDTRRLRAESRHLDEESWNGRRLAWLAQFLRAPRLFRTPVLARAFEAQARANLRRAVGAEPSSC